MKILEWMQKRINGNNEKKKPSHQISTTYHIRNEPCKQEFNDWPQTLLAIGTFGNENNNTKQKEDSEKSKGRALDLDPLCFQDLVDEFTLEEVGSLQNELNKYFRLPAEPNSSSVKPLNTEDSSLEEEGHESGKEEKNETFPDDGGFYQQSSRLMNAMAKNQCLDQSSKINGVAKKSLKFLLKKMFVCKSGFQPTTPFLKDPSSLSTESRLEKILRAILNKKIYPQGTSSSKMFIKKYLETKSMPQYYSDDDDEEFDKAVVNGCKWVKTDADYIVLEI
ncbi:hypothetical protein PIB30_019555 [Stylosanthes scabra]|uniref:Uncharacterized protein n=1 Tax=Stylosanthes scabra TaxID=79078 RepID=A0ABU6X5Q5_9FABA|nr:hypothetical protein [Stylosanthes scabra]